MPLVDLSLLKNIFPLVPETLQTTVLVLHTVVYTNAFIFLGWPQTLGPVSAWDAPLSPA